ncbi:ABC transporter ATP-binding protein [Leucobacter sp. OH1287]|uniref:ABC transporter ATP-binding protein n=1 Tax=Leucobacter sp. OH1287 TaxID=2491049 RepID=UPI000F603A3F|nr:ABC transporter ATP-binding protein [Leucobacter sp. OH1287]RRD60937.1 ABC transporter ATP-binding protein [Leucobacter sp. OH1287]
MVKVIKCSDVNYVRAGRTIISNLNWEVDSSDRWIIIGPNGAGKSTILKMLALLDYPSSGTVELLGKRLGRVDINELRPSIGVVTSESARRIPAGEKALNVVMTAAYGVSGRWNEYYDELDEKRALRVMSEWGVDSLAERSFGTLSDGEKKRTLIARAVMTDPELLLLDEPAASIDLGGREELVKTLSGFASSPFSPAMVMVTHHVEEIPPGFTHALLLNKDGSVLAQGSINEVVTGENLSNLFGVRLGVHQLNGRFSASAI